jgi:hypothetical protein
MSHNFHDFRDRKGKTVSELHKEAPYSQPCSNFVANVDHMVHPGSSKS